MSTKHVKQIMDQDALADLPKGSARIVTYFHQHINLYATDQKELREMFTLASALDLLRRGDVARVGDALLARFIAFRHSLLDQGWNK